MIFMMILMCIVLMMVKFVRNKLFDSSALDAFVDCERFEEIDASVCVFIVIFVVLG